MIALALITTYGGFGDFRQHWTFILLGHVLYTLPFMMRVVMAVLASIDIKTLEEGAASVGAPAHRRFVDIVLPNIRNGILAGASMVVTLSIGEFNVTWMLHTPSTKTLPVGLADSYAALRLEVASACTLVFFFMIIPCSSRCNLPPTSPVGHQHTATAEDRNGNGQKRLSRPNRHFHHFARLRQEFFQTVFENYSCSEVSWHFLTVFSK